MEWIIFGKFLVREKLKMANLRTYKDLLEMPVKYLKNFLTIRGISVSGYGKVELVARAFSLFSLTLDQHRASAE